MFPGMLSVGARTTPGAVQSGGSLNPLEINFDARTQVPIANMGSVAPTTGNCYVEDFVRYASIEAMNTTGSTPGNACVIGEDGYNALPGNAAADDTYSVYRTWANNSDPCISRYGADLSLVTGRNGVGKSVRFVYQPLPDPPNTPPADQQDRTLLMPKLQAARTYNRGVVIEMWVRYLTPGQSWYPKGGKWFEWWMVNGNRLQIGPGDAFGAQAARWECVWGSNAGGGINRTVSPFVNWAVNGESTTGRFNDGSWHRIQIHFQPQTVSNYQRTGGTTSADETYSGTCSMDGWVYLFCDGVLLYAWHNDLIGITPSGGSGPWCRAGDVACIPGLSGSNGMGGGFEHMQYAEVSNGTSGGFTEDRTEIRWGIF